MAVQHPARFGEETIRAEEESKRKKERDGERGSRKEAHFFDCSPVYKHYIFYEIYSLRLFSGGV